MGGASPDFVRGGDKRQGEDPELRVDEVNLMGCSQTAEEARARRYFSPERVLRAVMQGAVSPLVRPPLLASTGRSRTRHHLHQLQRRALHIFISASSPGAPGDAVPLK